MFGEITWLRPRVAAVLLLLALAGSALALSQWTQSAQAADGAICGSVWHWRPGHGQASGGQRNQQELDQVVAECREAAIRPFTVGAAAAGLAIVTLLGATIVMAAPAKA